MCLSLSARNVGSLGLLDDRVYVCVGALRVCVSGSVWRVRFREDEAAEREEEEEEELSLHSIIHLTRPPPSFSSSLPALAPKDQSQLHTPKPSAPPQHANCAA